ncbi:hypothetical protein Tco_0327884 [Tanacetum coccineum]
MLLNIGVLTQSICDTACPGGPTNGIDITLRVDWVGGLIDSDRWVKGCERWINPKVNLDGEVKTASTPMETQKPLLKDKDGEEVDVHMYRSMIGSLMYLTSSRPESYEAVYKELVRAATTASSLEAEQDSSSQETHGGTIAQTRFENVSKHSNDPLLARVTLAQVLAALKSVKPKVNANVVEEPSVPVSVANTKVSAATTTTTATIPTPTKGIVITELEPEKPLKKKDQISFDEQEAIRLQAEFDEIGETAKEKDTANVA